MTTKLKHPEATDPIQVRDDQVEMYESQGWERVPVEAEQSKAKKTATK